MDGKTRTYSHIYIYIHELYATSITGKSCRRRITDETRTRTINTWAAQARSRFRRRRNELLLNPGPRFGYYQIIWILNSQILLRARRRRWELFIWRRQRIVYDFYTFRYRFKIRHGWPRLPKNQQRSRNNNTVRTFWRFKKPHENLRSPSNFNVWSLLVSLNAPLVNTYGIQNTKICMLNP